mmetsp:Transcript_330/g.645  ORF Transcript_330/g.645 Transcript_330/m.645 type:complete len:205 (-) Transcript_330:41-655(-)|eukprot:CAMPEP_0202025312 /NCGR_PEP_ID=MMETSP0905-20130828/56189_1 /ASSEMBLY_ACC=CAM_ASM_000554 /TAXON_ID=420261 /ORGANISM="Thalassiosira antarctica, Strain CCMP982" /LENGTH=204 /DNA_ID=CAMNT_0048588191 /DNA_START=25 /DNA_END=639 /DNA_ORIENTATION=+
MNLMSNESMLAGEEAHWSSFRSAVVGLQHSLGEHAPAPTEIGDSSSSSSSRYHARRSTNIRPEEKGVPPTSDDCCNSTPRANPQSALEGVDAMNANAWKENAKPQNNAVGELETITSWDDTRNIETNQKHQVMELIGLEEVNKGLYSRNNTRGNDLFSPAHAPSHTSHTTDALSIAEQQLAETKLKLFMTEAERDELEFQLMQK